MEGGSQGPALPHRVQASIRLYSRYFRMHLALELLQLQWCLMIPTIIKTWPTEPLPVAKFEDRKGFDVLIRAVEEEFTGEEVCLLIRSTGNGPSYMWMLSMTNYTFIPHLKPQDQQAIEMPQHFSIHLYFMKSTDGYWNYRQPTYSRWSQAGDISIFPY